MIHILQAKPSSAFPAQSIDSCFQMCRNATRARHNGKPVRKTGPSVDYAFSMSVRRADLCVLASVSLKVSNIKRGSLFIKEEEERESIPPFMDTALLKVDLERYLNLG